jgi:cell wall assembly regulator SMI1
LGYAGATEQQLQQLERRLGVPALPPSYRAFLATSNGWRNTSPFIDRVWATDDVAWLSERNHELIRIWTSPGSVDCWERRNLPGALEISDWGDSALYVLNPASVDVRGEWEAAFFGNWIPGARVYPSFQALMEAEYALFCDLRDRGSIR